MAQSDTARKVGTLAEALPYIRRYHGKTVVVKYGGSAMSAAPLRRAFAQDVALLKLVGINPVVVHGGGPQINAALKRMGMPARFVEGMRYTDGDTMEIVEMVLGGSVNSQTVQMINDAGARAVGLTGKDGGLLRAKRIKIRKGADEVDAGLVGGVESVRADVVARLEEGGFIPVIAPVAADSSGAALNINADLAAAHVAAALSAEALLLLTNTDGVLDKKGKLVAELTAKKARAMLKSGAIDGGMKPKTECALFAVSNGARSCRIINGAVEHALLLEVFTDAGIGTRIAG